MCFFKKRAEKNKEDFFRYICDIFFKKEDSRDELAYEEILNRAALELMPDMDKFLGEQNKELPVEEIAEVCRDIAVKSLILSTLQNDKNDKYLNIITSEYKDEYDKMIKEKQLIEVPEDAIVKNKK